MIDYETNNKFSIWITFSQLTIYLINDWIWAKKSSDSNAFPEKINKEISRINDWEWTSDKIDIQMTFSQLNSVKPIEKSMNELNWH